MSNEMSFRNVLIPEESNRNLDPYSTLMLDPKANISISDIKLHYQTLLVIADQQANPFKVSKVDLTISYNLLTDKDLRKVFDDAFNGTDLCDFYTAWIAVENHLSLKGDEIEKKRQMTSRIFQEMESLRTELRELEKTANEMQDNLAYASSVNSQLREIVKEISESQSKFVDKMNDVLEVESRNTIRLLMETYKNCEILCNVTQSENNELQDKLVGGPDYNGLTESIRKDVEKFEAICDETVGQTKNFVGRSLSLHGNLKEMELKFTNYQKSIKK